MKLPILVISAAVVLTQSCCPETPLDISDVVVDEVGWDTIDSVYLDAVYDFVTIGEEADLWERMPVEAIVLESSGCYGSCPSYVARFDRGGQAHYLGRDYVEDLDGSHDGTIHVTAFARVCLLLERLRYVDMDSNYSASWTDDNCMTMTVTYAGEEAPVVVRDYGGQAPPEFYALTLAVEEAVRNIKWKRARAR